MNIKYSHMSVVVGLLVSAVLFGCNSNSSSSTPSPQGAGGPPQNASNSDKSQKSVGVETFSLERISSTTLNTVSPWSGYQPIDANNGTVLVRKNGNGSDVSYAVYNVAQNQLTPVSINCSANNISLVPQSDLSFQNGQVSFVSQSVDGSVLAASLVSAKSGKCRSIQLPQGAWLAPIVAGGQVFAVEKTESVIYALDFNSQKAIKVAQLNNSVYKAAFSNGKIYFLNLDLSIMTRPSLAPLLSSFDINTSAQSDLHFPNLEKWEQSGNAQTGFTQLKGASNNLILRADTSLGGTTSPGYFVVNLADLSSSYWVTTWSSNLDYANHSVNVAFDFDGKIISEAVLSSDFYNKNQLVLAMNDTSHGLVDAGQSFIFKGDTTQNYPLGVAIVQDQIFSIGWGSGGVTTLWKTALGSPNTAVESLPKGNGGNYRIGSGEGYVWTYAQDMPYPTNLRIYDGLTAQLKKTINIDSWISNGLMDVAIHGGKAYLSSPYFEIGHVLVADIDGGSANVQLDYPIPADAIDSSGEGPTWGTTSIAVVDQKLCVALPDLNRSKAYLISKDLQTGQTETVAASCGFVGCIGVDTSSHFAQQKLILQNGKAFIRFYGSDYLAEIDLSSHSSMWLPLGPGADYLAFDGQNIWALVNPGVRSFGRGDRNLIKLEAF